MTNSNYPPLLPKVLCVFQHYSQWVLIVAILASLALPVMAADLLPNQPPRLPNLDRRAESAVQNKALANKSNPERETAEGALRARLPKVQVQRHPIVASPRWIA